MDDREMLELAAKASAAAGMQIIPSEAGPQILERKSSDGVEFYRLWIPLTDDGDALRLAVKLQMRVSVEELQAGAITVEWGDDFEISVEERVPDESFDPYAATRLAIVRAAAEIGKAMK